MDSPFSQPPDREVRLSKNEKPKYDHTLARNTISQDETEQDDTLDHPKFIDLANAMPTSSSSIDVANLSVAAQFGKLAWDDQLVLLAREEGDKKDEEITGHISLQNIAKARDLGKDQNGNAGPLIELIMSVINGRSDLEIYGESHISRTFDFLLRTISKLEAENIALKLELEQPENTSERPMQSILGTSAAPEKAEPRIPSYEEFHMVICIRSEEGFYYRDVPRKFKVDDRFDHLRGRDEIEDMTEYLDDHPEVTFAVVAEYDCEKYLEKGSGGAGYRAGKLMQDSVAASKDSTRICLGSSILSVLKTILLSFPDRFAGYVPERLAKSMPEPFLFFYVNNRTLLELCTVCGLGDWQIDCIKLLCNWFEDNWRADWDEADELFSRGKVNAKHYKKLFRPNEILLRKEDGIIHCFKTYEYPWSIEGETRVNIWKWKFNGLFAKEDATIHLLRDMIQGLFISEKDGEKDITSLPTYPLRFDYAELYDKLAARGEKFWKCRKKILVCYQETSRDNELSQAERRFMIDYDIYRRLHPTKDVFTSMVDDLGEEVMNSDTPPGGDFLALLPPQIHAFDLSTKSWQFIRVDRTTSVTWNKDAFKRLVVPKDTKELIQAVVWGHKQKAGAALDIIAGKGNGLLILLHGSPGTGKTLTAESIAEHNEMPLYRVTCGDVGMEPAEVEQYLTVVLEIGKAWRCVVLLDEADVFVEERTLADQKRNAIISVFLRVLEYYDGILILTTNRVGTFDDAFKSRIQLALRYPDLDEQQRREIWGNFFQMLRRTKERIDFEDLEMNVRKLSEVEINGRQIRNAITTARHLAKFRNERLVYKHVQDAIAAVIKFNEYLSEVRGASDEVLAREDKLR